MLKGKKVGKKAWFLGAMAMVLVLLGVLFLFQQGRTFGKQSLEPLSGTSEVHGSKGLQSPDLKAAQVSPQRVLEKPGYWIRCELDC